MTFQMALAHASFPATSKSGTVQSGSQQPELTAEEPRAKALADEMSERDPTVAEKGS